MVVLVGVDQLVPAESFAGFEEGDGRDHEGGHLHGSGRPAGRCIRWTGPAIGDGLRIDRGTHVWNFAEVPGGVIVRTEESWTGAQIEADPATAIRYLAPGLDQWLADLKAAAEARAGRKTM